MNLLIKVILITAVMSGLYYGVVGWIGIVPRFAESNFIASQMRLQEMEKQTGGINIAITGSSLTGRLDIRAVSDTETNINLGLDGSNALLGSELLLDSGGCVEVLVLEMNDIYGDVEGNDEVLTDAMASTTNMVARRFPLVSARMRPVTLIYSKLKDYKDSRQSINLMVADHMGHTRIQPLSDLGVSARLNDRLEKIASRCRDREIRLVLLLMPDGDDRKSDPDVLQLMSYLSQRYQIEILNLKKEFVPGELVYTDGMHLSAPSAAFVAKVLAETLKQ